jgi:hypothetical protein
MPQSSAVGMSPSQIDARRAWLFPVIAWALQVHWTLSIGLIRDATTVLIVSVTLAVVQLLLFVRSIFHGVRALACRMPNETWVLAPAIIGLAISISTLALIALMIPSIFY